MHPEKEMITYIEEWEVTDPDEIGRLEPWPTEDVTLENVRCCWRKGWRDHKGFTIRNRAGSKVP